MYYPEHYCWITIPVYYKLEYTKHPIYDFTLSSPPPPPEDTLPTMSSFGQWLSQETIEPSMLVYNSVFDHQEDKTLVSIIFTLFFSLLTNFLMVKPLDDEGKVDAKDEGKVDVKDERKVDAKDEGKVEEIGKESSISVSLYLIGSTVRRRKRKLFVFINVR